MTPRSHFFSAAAPAEPATTRPRPARKARFFPRKRASSRPLPIHGEYIEDVLMEKSGRLRGHKSLQVQFLSPSRAASCKRRNDLLADPVRLAYSRHPRWLGASPAPSRRKAKTEAPPLLRVDNAPLINRPNECAACFHLILCAPLPVPPTFVSRMKHDADHIEPAHVPDLLTR